MFYADLSWVLLITHEKEECRHFNTDKLESARVMDYISQQWHVSSRFYHQLLLKNSHETENKHKHLFLAIAYEHLTLF